MLVWSRVIMTAGTLAGMSAFQQGATERAVYCARRDLGRS